MLDLVTAAVAIWARIRAKSELLLFETAAMSLHSFASLQSLK